MTDNSTQQHHEVADLMRQRYALEHQIARLQARSKELRERLLEHAEKHGVPDEHGHQRVTLETPVTLGEKTLTGFVRRRSVRQTFDEPRARELAEKRGILDRVLYVETVERIDQDAFWACQQEGHLTTEDIHDLISETHTYALWGQS